MKIMLLSSNGVSRVLVEGKITQAELLSKSDALERSLGDDPFRQRVLLDMEKITFLDSAGISWMLTQHKRFNAQGGRIVFCSIPPMIRGMLKLLNVDQVLHIAEDSSGGEQMLQEGS